MGYDSEQLRIAARIVRIGRKRGESRKEIVSALETGLVESGLRNLPGGDADSRGWRQERSSLYRNPQNVRASINRYFDETSQLGDGRGMTAGELAARVQRPRADLRGRYQDRRADAKALLAHLTRGQPLPGGGGAGQQQSAAGLLLGGSGAASVGAASTAATDMLAQIQQQRQQRGSVGLSMPAFAAAAALPQGYQAPASGGGPVAQPKMADLISQIRTAGASVPRGEQASLLIGTASGIPQVQEAKGGAIGPEQALVAKLTRRANIIDAQKLPYQWGGGHAGKTRLRKAIPLDCSGAVSKVLGINPRVSGEFTKWGKPGRGAVTVYANGEHVLMEINGRFWGTSKSNPGGGAGWIPRSAISDAYLSRFTARHVGSTGKRKK